MSESKPGPIRRFLVGIWNTVNFTRRLVFNLVFVVLLFAFSTTITWAYYGAKACSFLFKESKVALYGFKFFYLAMAVVGCTMPLASIVDIADGLLFIMAIPNLIGVYLLMPVVKRELKSYLARLKSGEIARTDGTAVIPAQ